MATAIWNASDALNTSLDATKLIATSSSGQAAIRANQGQTSGRYYWEYTFTTAIQGDTGCGIANATAPLNLTGSNATGACFIYKGFAVYLNGSPTGISIGTISTGTIVGIAVDFTAQKVWFRIAPSGNWNGNATYDPVAGTGGISYAAIATGGIFPCASMWQTNDAITANFGATAFTGTVPTGFTSGVPVLNTIENLAKITAYTPLIQGEAISAVRAYSVVRQGEEVGTVKAYSVLVQGGVSALNVRAYAVLSQQPIGSVSATGRVGTVRVPTTTFTPALSGPNVTLSNGNLTATCSSTVSGGTGAATTDGKLTGKYYFEFTCTTINNGNTGVGVTSLCNYQTISTTVPEAAFAFKSGDVWILGANRFNIGTIINGAVVCVALDLDNRRYFCRLGAAGNWNGSSSITPATPSTGYDISAWVAAGFALRPGVALGQTNDSVTANFGASNFTGAVPSGYNLGFTTSSYSRLSATFGTSGPAAAIIDGGLTVLTPTLGTATTDGATSLAGKQVGKWYFEYTIDHGNQGQQFSQCGICTQAPPPSYDAEYTNVPHSCVTSSRGNLFCGNTTVIAQLNGGTTITTGTTTYAIAIDLDNKRAFFRSSTTSSTLWNASGPVDPTVPATGIDISTLLANFAVAYPTIWASGGIGCRANFGDSAFVYTVPNGYTAWNATTVGNTYEIVTQVGVEQWGQIAADVRLTQVAVEEWSAQITDLRATQVAVEEWSAQVTDVRATQVAVEIWKQVGQSITGVVGAGAAGTVRGVLTLTPLALRVTQVGSSAWVRNITTPFRATQIGSSVWGQNISPPLRATQIGASVWVRVDPSKAIQIDGVSGSGQVGVTRLATRLVGAAGAGLAGTERDSITLRLSSVNGSARIHNVIANIAIPETGVYATGLTHAVALRKFQGVTATGLAGILRKIVVDQGVQGKGLAGNANAKESIPIPGVSGNTLSGHVVPSVSVRLASVQANSLVGHFPVIKRVIGVSATGLVGTLTESIAAMKGVNATGLVGLIKKAIANRIIGVQGNGFVASIRGANRITGVYGTGLCGRLFTGNLITGVQGKGFAGSIVIIRHVKGLFATALLGALRVQILKRITGNQAVGQVGQITPHSFGDMTFVHIPSVACVGYAGKVTVYIFGDKTFVHIIGVGGVGQVGRPTSRMRGGQGTAKCGRVIVRIAHLLNGLFARGRAGVLVPQGSKHRYWQIAILANEGGSIYSMAEVQFRSVPDTPLLFSGGTASATQSATSPANATDDDTSTYWSSSNTSAGQVWGYDYGVGNGLNVLQISITARCDNDTGYLETPSSFNLRWSDNGLAWITVGTFVTTWTERCETQVFDVTELETALQLSGTARETIVIDQAVTSLSNLVVETITESDVIALIGAAICEVLRTSDLQPTRITVDMVMREIVNIAASRGRLSNIVRETLDVGRGTISLENMAREVVTTMAMSSTSFMNLVREIIHMTVARIQMFGLVCEVLRNPDIAPSRIEVIGMTRESVVALITSAELASLIREVITQVEAVSQWSEVVREVLRTPDAAPIRIEVDGVAREALVDKRGRGQTSAMAREATVMSRSALRMDRLALEVMGIDPAETVVSTIVHEVIDTVDAQMSMSTMALELLRSTSSKPTEIIANTLACESVYITTSIMQVATMVFESLIKIPVDALKSAAVARETMSRDITRMKTGGVVREVLIAGREQPMLINVSVNM